jgi:NADH-quinone oxidoreductase subunit L
VFITAFYSFRMLFLAFHGAERFEAAHHDEHAHDPAHAHDESHEAGDEPHASDHGGPPHETPWVVTLPLILLAIPSVYTGWVYIEPMLFGDYFGRSIVVAEANNVLGELKAEWHGVVPFILHGFTSAPFWLALAGIAAAAYCYLVNPALPGRVQQKLRGLYTLLDNKYYFDRFNDWFFAGGARKVGSVASQVGDRTLIDGLMVNGTARVVGWSAALIRHLQSGYVYHYAFTMIIGVFVLLYWWGVR